MMASQRSVLVLQSDLRDEEILDMLETLLEKVEELTTSPKLPAELFSLVCASGAAGTLAILLGRLAKSPEECRSFLKHLAQFSHEQQPFASWSAYEAHHLREKCLEDMCDANSKFMFPEIRGVDTGEDCAKRCHSFVLVPRSPESAPSPLMTYQYYHASKTDKEITTQKVLKESLCVRDFPFKASILCEGIEAPWHALVSEIAIRKTLHNETCVWLGRNINKDLSDKFGEHSIRHIELVPGAPRENFIQAALFLCKHPQLDPLFYQRS